MKQFWRKIIFADHPAQGAFFALWLLMLGSYVLFSLLLLVIAGDWSQPVLHWQWCKWGWLAGQIGLIAYYNLCNWRFWATVGHRRYFFAPVLLLLVIFAVGSGRGSFDELVFIILFLLPFWGVPLAAGLSPVSIPLLEDWRKLPKVRPMRLVVGVVGILLMVWLLTVVWSWQWAVILGAVAMLIVFGGIHRIVAWQSVGLRLLAAGLLLTGIWGLLLTIVSYDYHVVEYGCPLANLPFLYWHRWFFCLSLLFIWLTAAVLLYGCVLARAAGLPWRRLWTTPLFALIGLTLAVYALSWILATASETRVLDMREQLARRFGHEISLAGLAQYYPRMQTPEEQQTRLQLAQFCEELKINDDDTPSRWSKDDAPEDPVGQKILDYIASHPEKMKQLDQLLPPAGAGYPQKIERNEVESYFDFTKKYPVGNILLWRLYYASQKGDTQAAVAELRHLQNWVDYQKYFFPINDLDYPTLGRFFRCTLAYSLNEDNVYLAGLIILLANGRLSDQDMDGALQRLCRREQELQLRNPALIYMLCVNDWERYHGWWRDNYHVGFMGLSAWQLRPFVPAAWYYFNRDLAQSWQRCLDGDAADKTDGRSLRISLDQFRRYQLDTVDTAISIRLTRLRLAEALIEIERYRQKHGALPESMPDLPLDPFSGKPLCYHPGKRQATIESRGDICWGGKKLAFPSPRVWSVGINGKDDDGRDDWDISLDINL